MKLLLTNLLISVGVVACAASPALLPETPKQTALVANYSLEGMNRTVSHMYCPDPPECLLGTITKDQAKALRTQLKTAETALDLADAAILAGDSTTATTQLQLVDSLLLELKKQLLLKSSTGAK